MDNFPYELAETETDAKIIVSKMLEHYPDITNYRGEYGVWGHLYAAVIMRGDFDVIKKIRGILDKHDTKYSTYLETSFRGSNIPPSAYIKILNLDSAELVLKIYRTGCFRDQIVFLQQITETPEILRAKNLYALPRFIFKQVSGIYWLLMLMPEPEFKKFVAHFCSKHIRVRAEIMEETYTKKHTRPTELITDTSGMSFPKTI